MRCGFRYAARSIGVGMTTTGSLSRVLGSGGWRCVGSGVCRGYTGCSTGFPTVGSALARVQAAIILLQKTVGGTLDIIPKPGFPIFLITLTTQALAPSFEQPFPHSLDWTTGALGSAVDLDPRFGSGTGYSSRCRFCIFLIGGRGRDGCDG